MTFCFLSVITSNLIFSICSPSLSVFSEFDGIEIRSRVQFNKREQKSAGLTSDDFSGPTVSFQKYGVLKSHRLAHCYDGASLRYNDVMVAFCVDKFPAMIAAKVAYLGISPKSLDPPTESLSLL